MTDEAIGRDARAWTFDELVREGVSLIPALAPDWTNHNASDPGITLVELLAYFSEVLAYRALRITPDAKLNFLRLLMGPDWEGWQELIGIATDRLDTAIEACIERLSHQECLSSLADFERAALQACRDELRSDAPLRVLAVPGVDLRQLQMPRNPDAAAEAAGDVSVVLAPESELGADRLAALCAAVQRSLATRCQLTARVHVVAPVYLHVFVSCRMALQPGQSLAGVRARFDAALQRRFGPIAPHETAAAELRPFGRRLFISEIVDVLGQVEGVDWLDQVEVRRLSTRSGEFHEGDGQVGLRIGVIASIGEDTCLGGFASVPARRFLRDDAKEVISIHVQPWEIVRVKLAHEAVFAVPSQERRR